MHALHGQRFGFVDGLELAAGHRTNCNGGDLHAGQSHIDAELGLSVDFIRRVEPLGWRADQRKVLGVLEHDFVSGGHRQRCRLLRECAIVKHAAGRVVDHIARFGAAGRGLHAPGLRRGFDKEHTGSRTCLTQRLPEGPYRSRPASYLEPDKRIGIKPVVRRRVLDLHLAEFHLQFLGNEHGHGSIGALAHLHLAHDQRYAAIAADTQKGVGRKVVCR